MAKFASILAVLYLAVAPAANIASLLHSVEACRFFSHHHHHEHEDEAPSHPDCPDCDNLVVERNVLPTGAMQAEIEAAAPFRVNVPQAPAQYVGGKDAAMRERPPPLLYVGIVLLLV